MTNSRLNLHQALLAQIEAPGQKAKSWHKLCQGIATSMHMKLFSSLCFLPIHHDDTRLVDGEEQANDIAISTAKPSNKSILFPFFWFTQLETRCCRAVLLSSPLQESHTGLAKEINQPHETPPPPPVFRATGMTSSLRFSTKGFLISTYSQSAKCLKERHVAAAPLCRNCLDGLGHLRTKQELCGLERLSLVFPKENLWGLLEESFKWLNLHVGPKRAGENFIL